MIRRWGRKAQRIPATTRNAELVRLLRERDDSLSTLAADRLEALEAAWVKAISETMANKTREVLAAARLAALRPAAPAATPPASKGKPN